MVPRRESAVMVRRPAGMAAGMIVTVVAAVVAVVVVVWFAAFKPIVLPPPLVAESRPAHDTPAFVGSQACANCHLAQFTRWQRSTHGRAGGTPSPDLVLAPFNGAPIRFANATVIPRSLRSRYEF